MQARRRSMRALFLAKISSAPKMVLLTVANV
jgi:hypothetical protein